MKYTKQIINALFSFVGLLWFNQVSWDWEAMHAGSPYPNSDINWNKKNTRKCTTSLIIWGELHLYESALHITELCI